MIQCFQKKKRKGGPRMELSYVITRYEGGYDALVQRLRVNDDLEDEFRDIYDECLKIARPKGRIGASPRMPPRVSGSGISQRLAVQTRRSSISPL